MRSPFLLRLALSVAGALFVGPARAFDLIGSSWPNGDIVLQLQLGPGPSPLMDGSADWATVAESVISEWNQQLTRSKLTSVRDSTAAVARGNRINNVVFRTDFYGTAFDARTLAVTLSSTSPSSGRSLEKDVIFNSNRTWNSYRGNLRNGTSEFRRVALHEFGHVLGLDHPDQATPVQIVEAVMNSTVSSVESLRADDIAGAHALYDLNTDIAPTIAAHPQSKTVPVGAEYTMAVTVNGNGPFIYTWTYQAPGSRTIEPFTLATGASYTIGSVQAADAGTYRVRVSSGGGGFVDSTAATLTVTPIATSSDTQLANISTRGVVGSGSGVLIAGLIIGGTTTKTVFFRAAGPALSDLGVRGALTDPSLAIFNVQSQVVAQNDNWENQGTGGDAAAIAAASTRLGAFQFKAGSRDAALLVNLPPGNYTAVVSGVNNATGVALVEAYDADADPVAARSRKLVNIATRGQVGSGDNTLIAGLVVAGPGPRTYLVRAIGPTLAKAPFNVSGALLDPFLQIYQGENLLRENDDWDSSASAQPALSEASTRVGAFAMTPTRDPVTRSGLDSAMLITLQPGNYTAKVSGFQGAVGVALVEIYELP